MSTTWVEIEEVPGRGWVVEGRTEHGYAIAQGETLKESFANLAELYENYPEVLA